MAQAAATPKTRLAGTAIAAAAIGAVALGAILLSRKDRNKNNEHGYQQDWQQVEVYNLQSGTLRIFASPNKNARVRDEVGTGTLLRNYGCDAYNGEIWCEVSTINYRTRGWARDRYLRPSYGSGDYPDYGYRLGEAIAEGRATRGVALCGSGIGISISVNRNPAARCALVSEPLSAKLAREHNDANVLAMGARLIGEDMAKACLMSFLVGEFAGGRHGPRVDKLNHPHFSKEPA